MCMAYRKKSFLKTSDLGVMATQEYSNLLQLHKKRDVLFSVLIIKMFLTLTFLRERNLTFAAIRNTCKSPNIEFVN